MNADPSTEIVPPWRSTIAETIDSPSPEPGCSEESGRAPEALEQPLAVTGIGPGPLVCDRQHRDRLRRPSSTVTWPPSGP